MARFINIEQANQHAGIERVVRATAGAEVAGTFAANVIVAVLSAIGRPVTGAFARIGAVLEAQAAARKQRRDDERLWAVAMQDARVMADLSRAMSQSAARELKN